MPRLSWPVLFLSLPLLPHLYQLPTSALVTLASIVPALPLSKTYKINPICLPFVHLRKHTFLKAHRLIKPQIFRFSSPHNMENIIKEGEQMMEGGNNNQGQGNNNNNQNQSYDNQSSNQGNNQQQSSSGGGGGGFMQGMEQNTEDAYINNGKLCTTTYRNADAETLCRGK